MNERPRSSHQTRRKHSVLEAYDYGRRKMFTTMSAEKEVRVGEVKHRKGKQRRRYQKKVMLSMWWNWKGLVFYELLPKNKTINSDVYCEQLQKLSDAIAQKRPELINRKGVVFHHDNVRPHTSLITRQKLSQHGWDVTTSTV